MLRSTLFHHQLSDSTALVPESTGGALPFLQPTHAKLVDLHQGDTRTVTWNARNHRKQRHKTSSPRSGRPRIAESTWERIGRMSHLELWNISWWVSVLFTMGSVIWVVNGFIVFLPFITSTAEDPVAGGWSGWVGATIFEVGSLLLILEAWNRDETAGFGHAVEIALKGMQRHNGEAAEMLEKDDGQPHWKWWSWDPKYWHELGFLAGISQLCGASIFWISGFTGLSQIQEVLQRHAAALDGIFWTPQVVGGTGFIISSVLYMLETQKKWYIPAWKSLGWHIGFWNFVGAIGFTLCGAFGYSNGLLYQSCLSTFWGSWAFLIGSVIQWYEAVNPIRTL